MFQYFNMDHAMESGIAAADEIMAGSTKLRGSRRDDRILAEACP
jgi:hypothetical protein